MTTQPLSPLTMLLSRHTRVTVARVSFVERADADREKAAAARAAATSRRMLGPRQANEMSWFLSGIARMRLPVAAKNALSTAGAATKMVGSPTPPQKPPDGMMIDS